MFANAVCAEGGPGSTAVAAGSSQAAAAASAIVSAGGTAVDAVVAAGFATPVCEPVLSSIAGGGFCLYASPDGEPELLDFFVDVPGLGGKRSRPHVETKIVHFTENTEQVFHAGWGTVATPGCLAGYLDAHARWGRLPLADVLRPAQQMARQGVVLDSIQVRFLEVVEPILASTAESRAIYEPARISGRMVNENYADVLDALADGRISGARDPQWIERITEAVYAGGGVLSAEDMYAYRPILRSPVHTTHSGAHVWTNPPPSFGGSIVIDALDLISAAGSSGAPSWASVVTALGTATQRSRRVTDVTRGTTHISVIDRFGGMASMSVSNGSGSGTVVDGVQMNNMLGEEDLNAAIRENGIGAIHELEPGTRMGSMMAPTIAQLSDGSEVALGTGGSERIRSAITTVLVNILDRKTTMADAISAPRMHISGGRIDVEPHAELAVESIDGLPVHRWDAPDLFFGGVHGVGRRSDGSVVAVGDSRRGGSVAIGN